MDKVKVNREVFEVLEKRHEKATDQHMLNLHAQLGIKGLEEVGLYELAEMLINGYEVEETPEEKLTEWYNSLSGYKCSYASDNVRLGIKETLEFLNIKIEGINK